MNLERAVNEPTRTPRPTALIEVSDDMAAELGTLAQVNQEYHAAGSIAEHRSPTCWSTWSRARIRRTVSCGRRSSGRKSQAGEKTMQAGLPTLTRDSTRSWHLKLKARGISTN